MIVMSGILQRIKCFRCPRKPDCDLMKALLKLHDEWRKTESPRIKAALERADKLLKVIE